MTSWKSASVGAALAGLACAAPAFADVTADEVWSSWKNLAERSGQTVSGTESRSGDTLTVSDISASMSLPDGGVVAVGLGEIRFTERSDGTVAIEMSEAYPISVTGTSDTGGAMEMAMTARQKGLSMIASGDADETAYDFVAPEASFTLDSLVVDGTPMDMRLEMVMERLAGKYLVSGTDLREVDTDFSAEAVRFGMNAVNPDDGSRIALAGSADKLSSTSVSTIPAEMDMADLGGMLAAGFASRGGLEYTNMSYVMDVTETDQTSNIAVVTDRSTLDFALADGAMVYDATASGMQMTLKGSAIPFPQVDVAMDESAFRFEMPMVQTEAPADFGFLTRIAGLTVSDQIWSIFDPTGQLPRDPATLVLDLGGKARWLVDITDPTAMAQADGTDATPGELHALNIKDLELSIAGADLTGKGSFTFDNSDTTTFDGMPRPMGDLALRLEGGNGLLDKLVAMGLMPEEQAMGMRMMLGMFARPTGGDDTMVSEITVTEDGQVLANGQRLR